MISFGEKHGLDGYDIILLTIKDSGTVWSVVDTLLKKPLPSTMTYLEVETPLNDTTSKISTPCATNIIISKAPRPSSSSKTPNPPYDVTLDNA